MKQINNESKQMINPFENMKTYGGYYGCADDVFKSIGNNNDNHKPFQFLRLQNTQAFIENYKNTLKTGNYKCGLKPHLQNGRNNGIALTKNVKEIGRTGKPKLYFYVDLMHKYVEYLDPRYAPLLTIKIRQSLESLLSRKLQRERGVQGRKLLTSSIQSATYSLPKNQTNFLMAYVTNMGYKVCFDKVAKQIKVYTDDRNPRDFIDETGLWLLERFEIQLEGCILDSKIDNQKDLEDLVNAFSERFRHKYIKNTELSLHNTPIASKVDVRFLGN